LHTHPNSGAIAEQFAEANCYRGRYRFTLTQNIVEMLARDDEKLRNLSPYVT
jgi:hypothetical protein